MVMYNQEYDDLPMRILFLIDQLRRGGAERLLLDLLPRLPAHGIEPSLCVLGREVPLREEFVRAGVEPLLLAAGKWDPRIVDRLAALIRAEEIDLVSAHLGKSIVLGWLAARRVGVPFVAHEHVGPAWPHLGGGIRHRLENRVMWHATEWCLCRSAAVVAVSEPCRQWLVDRHPSLLARTTAIANGIDLGGLDTLWRERQRCRDEVRQEFALPAASEIVLYAASFRPVKRWDVWLDVAAHLSRFCPQAHFIGCGDGPLHSEMQARVVALGLERRVHLPGLRNDVPRLMAAADLFLLPTAMESDGIVAKEAMAMGLPLVASDIPILRDKIEPAGGGFLLPVGDVHGLSSACIRLLEDSALRTTCGRAGREYARAHFDISTCVDKTQRLLRAVGRNSRSQDGFVPTD